jgi:phycoerythrin-associated linker protein
LVVLLTKTALLRSIPPSSSETSGWSFRPSRNLQDAPTRLGVGAGEEGMTYRVEVTGYSANNVRRISRYVRSNRVYYVPLTSSLSNSFGFTAKAEKSQASLR